MIEKMQRGFGTFGARRIVAELLVVFVGVTAAFIVEGFRSDLAERQQLRRTSEGILIELERYQIKALEHADSIQTRIDRWQAHDRAGRKAVLDFYRIPGAPSPPSAAWDAAVSTGVASMFEPELRLALGYFYSEFLGIHQNYIRSLEFIEQVALPAVQRGPQAFYDTTGQLRPEFKARISLLLEFSEDLRQASVQAGELEAWLRTGKPPE